MDWDKAIERQRAVLLRLVGLLIGLAAQAVQGGVLPKAMHGRLVRLLVPAESAARRLVVIVAQGLTIKPRGSRGGGATVPVGGGERRPCFRLIDPRKRFAELAGTGYARGLPQIVVPGVDERLTVPPTPLGVTAAPFERRLAALDIALKNLPFQARRLLRREARQKVGHGSSASLGPLRPGWPPGYRRRHRHWVDAVVLECDGLARRALADTS